LDVLLAVTAVSTSAAVASGVLFALSRSSARRAHGRAEAHARDASEALRLLRAAMDAAPAATVLLSDLGVVVLTNAPARDMFAEGKELEGQNFLTLLGNAPAAFREALVGEQDALFTVREGEGADGEGEGDTFRLTKRHVELDGRTCMLLTVEQVTREVRRQEVLVWKKLLRTLSHELNNSLAPISSLVHSARIIAGKPEHEGKLARVFDTIEERTTHLQEFLEGYVRFARLPKPRPQRVGWGTFLARVREMFPLARVHDPAAEAEGQGGWFDPAQLEQVVLNLLKNAEESGSPREAVELEVFAREDGGFDVVVRDRGPGMSREVLGSALLPFYSTKERGTGLGLALCREIVESHGGKIRLQNRDGGGLVVTCALPPKDVATSPATAKITLTLG
jgi:nitrogen fixation/metabolism regulation signal transduction histidine kinase